MNNYIEMRLATVFFLIIFGVGLNAQNLGIKLPYGTSPNTTLDINGSLAYREGTAKNITSATTNDLAVDSMSFYRITTSLTSNFTITGFTGGQNGRVLSLYNATSYSMTLAHQTSSSSANQIVTGTGANITIGSGGLVTLYYNATLSKWICMSSMGMSSSNWSLTGNSGTTAGTNFIGTTDNQNLVFKTNNSNSITIPVEGRGGQILFNNNKLSAVYQSRIGYQWYAPPTNIDTSFSIIGTIGVNDYFMITGSVPSNTVATTGELHIATADDADEPIIFGQYDQAVNTYYERMRVHNNGYIGVGTKAPSRRLTVSRSASTNDTEDDIQIQSYGTYRAPAFIMTSGRGTETVPTNLSNGDTLGGVYFKGYFNGSEGSLGAITNIYTGNGTTSKSMMVFNTSGSGTANEKMRIDENGSVGIGTTTPGYKLHIEEPGGYNGDIGIRLYNTNNSSYLPSLVLQAAKGTRSAPTTLTSGYPLGAVYFGGYDGSSFVDIYGASVTSRASQDWTSAAHGSILEFYTVANGSTSPSNRMVIDHTGDVGIGISSPSVKLHQDKGTATDNYHKFTAGSTTGQTASDGFDVGVDASGNAVLNQKEALPLVMSANNSEVMRVTSAGNVLIGGNLTPGEVTGVALVNQSASDQKDDVTITTYNSTTTPAFVLFKARGTAAAPSTLTNNENLGGFNVNGYAGSSFRGLTSVSTITASDFTTSFGADIAFKTSRSGTSTEQMRITSTGNVGIGVTAPSHILQINGQGRATNSAWATTSDIRLKNIDRPFEYGLKELLKINTYRFHYKKDNPLKLPSDKDFQGVMAQELQKVIPEAVTKQADGYLTVNSDPVFWTMVNSIKEQQKIIDDQKKRIEELENQNQSMKSDTQELKNEVSVLKDKFDQLMKQLTKNN